MPSSNTHNQHKPVDAYVDLVCRQIRWKKAHKRVAAEMQSHILDGQSFYQEQGLEEAAALEKALANTGDAVEIGAQLDRIHRPKPQWGMLGLTAALLLLGLLIRMFIYNDEDRVGLLSLRLLYTGLGVGGMVAAYFTDFSVFGKYPKAIYGGIVSVAALLLLFMPSTNGRVFYAYYMALLFPLAFAAIVFFMKNRGYAGIVLCGFAFAIPGYMALGISSLSIFLHYAVVCAAVVVAAICKNWFGTKRIASFFVALVPSALAAVLFYMRLAPYRKDRLLAFINPASVPQEGGYSSLMVRELLAGAKWLGQGEIPDAYHYHITEPDFIFYTDLLLTAIISLLGWSAFALVGGFLLFFMGKGFWLCFRQKSSLGFFVTFTVMATLSVQVISYVVYNLGFLAVSPLSLPLISFGNTAVVINLGLIGFMLSAFRTGDWVREDRLAASRKRRRIFSWQDGRLIMEIDFRRARG